MPQVFVYIRQDDYDKWKSIEKKSEFIHNALNGMSINFGEDVEQVDLIDVRLHKKPSKIKEDVPPFSRVGRQPIPKSFSARKKK